MSGPEREAPIERIGVLGGGSWGTLLADLLARTERPSGRSIPVTLWVQDEPLRESLEKDRRHPRIEGSFMLSEQVALSADLPQVVSQSTLMFLAVPTTSFRAVARRLGPVLQGDQPLVSAAKGLEEGTGKRMSEILLEETCVRQVGALAGPTHPGEMARGNPGVAVIGSRYNAVVDRVQMLLSSSRMRVYGNQDLLGVELGGALASIGALLFGIAEGLALGAATKAAVLDRALAEFVRLGSACGAQAATFQGLSCLGDMVAAALHRDSRDHRLGEALAQGEAVGPAIERIGAVECISTTRMALTLAARVHVETPLLEAMALVLLEGKHPRDIIRALMTRRVTYEGR